MILESVPSKILKNPLSWILLAHGAGTTRDDLLWQQKYFFPFRLTKKNRHPESRVYKRSGKKPEKITVQPFPIYLVREIPLFFF